MSNVVPFVETSRRQMERQLELLYEQKWSGLKEAHALHDNLDKIYETLRRLSAEDIERETEIALIEFALCKPPPPTMCVEMARPNRELEWARAEVGACNREIEECYMRISRLMDRRETCQTLIWSVEHSNQEKYGF